jgi:hypothetical protein
VNKHEATDWDNLRSNVSPEYESGVKPPEAEHTFSRRIINSLEKPDFDGPSSPDAMLEQVYRIERGGGRQSPEGLGYLAGAAVLAQYRAAKAEVGTRWWQSALIALTEGHGMLALAVPFVAFSAGVTIDIAIFGGAAEELMHANPWFKSLAAGSVVFAAGIGLSKHTGFRTSLTVMLAVASGGASMLAADNPNFKAHFANMLPSTLREQSYGANQGLAVAQAQVKYAAEKLDRDTFHLQHGGIGGKPILADGYPGNDKEGLQLLNITIPRDEKALQEANAAVARSSSNKNVADAESPASWWGQVLGGIYLGVWLIASQLAIAKVIDSAATNLKTGRKQIAQRGLKELFVRDLESSRGEAVAKTAVGDMLHRYRDAMTDACLKNPIAQEVESRLAELDRLFSGEDIVKAMETGTQMVKDSVHPRREQFEEYDKNLWGFIGKVMNLGQRRRGASSGYQANAAPAP